MNEKSECYHLFLFECCFVWVIASIQISFFSRLRRCKDFLSSGISSLHQTVLKLTFELLNLLKFIYQSNGAKWKNLVVAKTDVKAKKELAV